MAGSLIILVHFIAAGLFGVVAGVILWWALGVRPLRAIGRMFACMYLLFGIWFAAAILCAAVTDAVPGTGSSFPFGIRALLIGAATVWATCATIRAFVRRLLPARPRAARIFTNTTTGVIFAMELAISAVGAPTVLSWTYDPALGAAVPGSVRIIYLDRDRVIRTIHLGHASTTQPQLPSGSVVSGWLSAATRPDGQGYDLVDGFTGPVGVGEPRVIAERVFGPNARVSNWLFHRASDLRAAGSGQFDVFSMDLDGISVYVVDRASREERRFGLVGLFRITNPRSATVIDGDYVVLQVNDQIVLLDLARHRMRALAHGRYPIVVLE